MNALENTAGIAPPSRGGATAWLILSAIIVLADQVTKNYITRHFGEFEFTSVLPILDITRMHNVGAAFSFLATASGWQRWAVHRSGGGREHRHRRLVGAAAARCTRSARGRPRIGAGRSHRQRHRSDSIGACHRFHNTFHWDRAYFPAFNVADSAITVGAACLLLDALFDSKRKT